MPSSPKSTTTRRTRSPLDEYGRAARRAAINFAHRGEGELRNMAVNPETLDDPKLVRNLLVNAQRANREDLVLKCQVRLAQLEGKRYQTALEQEFWAAVRAAEELASAKNGRTTRLTRTRQKAARAGIKRCLEDWAFHSGTTQGFDILVDGGHPELTGEAIVLRHSQEFSPEAVAAARERLVKHGVDPLKI